MVSDRDRCDATEGGRFRCPGYPQETPPPPEDAGLPGRFEDWRAAGFDAGRCPVRDVLDQIGVQNKDPYIKYAVEAEWGPNGAVCLNPGNTRLANQSIGCQIPTCGTSFASGGLIQSGKITSL